MHAVLVRVNIKPGRHDEAMQQLQSSVVPNVKGVPGLVRGTWFGDAESGHGLMVFQSQEQAEHMATMVSAADDDPVEIRDVGVYEVTAET